MYLQFVLAALLALSGVAGHASQAQGSSAHQQRVVPAVAGTSVGIPNPPYAPADGVSLKKLAIVVPPVGPSDPVVAPVGPLETQAAAGEVVADQLVAPKRVESEVVKTVGFQTMLGTYDALPSAATQRSVAAIVGWRLGAYGADPSSSMTYATGDGGVGARYKNQTVLLPRVFGHRDVWFTACPGNGGKPRFRTFERWRTAWRARCSPSSTPSGKSMRSPHLALARSPPEAGRSTPTPARRSWCRCMSTAAPTP